ncbi:Hok/Gef family protein [Obesumbacterium proteus]|uniref:Hok/Gef family protein n=1 Tax=Obesumbacterium proteus TaxID=82983 RepID=UPI0024320D00|nr:Hok/Gef family protein [Obesumbacterium proteus]
MSRKLLLYGLIVMCFTLLIFTWMVRGSLCELRIKQGKTEVAAFLNCEDKHAL